MRLRGTAMGGARLVRNRSRCWYMAARVNPRWAAGACSMEMARPCSTWRRTVCLQTGLGDDLCSRGAAQPTSNTLNRSPMCRQTQVVAMFDDNDLMVVVTLLNIGIMLSVVGYHYVAK